MNEIIKLELNLFIRKLNTLSLKLNNLILIGILLLIGICLIQYNLFVANDNFSTFLQGWIIIGLIGINAIFGIVTNRIPSHTKYITWVYSAPIGDSKILWAFFVSKSIPRFTVWLISAVLLDIFFLITGSWYFVLGQAVICYSVFLIMDLISFSFSTIRGNFKSLIVFSSLFIVYILGFSLISILIFFQSVDFKLENSIMEIGRLLNGSISLVSLTFLLIVLFICTTIIYSYGRSASFKEKLVFEGDFWSQYQDFNSFLNSFKGRTAYKTWWGGKVFNGIYTYAWFELLLLKKNLKSLLFQLVLTLALCYILLNFNESFYYILLVFFIISNLFSGFASGPIRHYQSESLLNTPGSLIHKVSIIELTSNLPTIFSYLLLNFLAIYLGALPKPIIFICLLFVFVLSFIIRLYIFFDMVKNNNLSGFNYFKQMITISVCSLVMTLIGYLLLNIMSVVLFIISTIILLLTLKIINYSRCI